MTFTETNTVEQMILDAATSHGSATSGCTTQIAEIAPAAGPNSRTAGASFSNQWLEKCLTLPDLELP